jgi:hypothetical protein
MDAAEVRKLLGPNMILGVSTKSCAEVREIVLAILLLPHIRHRTLVS